MWRASDTNVATASSNAACDNTLPRNTTFISCRTVIAIWMLTKMYILSYFCSHGVDYG